MSECVNIHIRMSNSIYSSTISLYVTISGCDEAALVFFMHFLG